MLLFSAGIQNIDILHKSTINQGGRNESTSKQKEFTWSDDEVQLLGAALELKSQPQILRIANFA